jgi:hypothetical protein
MHFETNIKKLYPYSPILQEPPKNTGEIFSPNTTFNIAYIYHNLHTLARPQIIQGRIHYMNNGN